MVYTQAVNELSRKKTKMIKTTVAEKHITARFTIVANDFDKVKTMLDKVNKTGLFSITEVIKEQKIITITKPTIKSVMVDYLKLTIQGTVRGIPGFDIIGRLEDDESSSRIIHPFSEEKNLSSFRNVSLFCDHCKVKQRRISSWVFENKETGDLMQVGNSCIEKYTGMTANAADVIRKVFQIGDIFGVTADNEQRFGERFGTTALSINDVLAIAAAVVLKDGRFFGQKFAENSTKTQVAYHIHLRKDNRPLIEAHKHHVQPIIDAVNALEYDDNHKMANWYDNLKSILDNGADGYVGLKRLGLLVSAAFFLPAIATKEKKYNNEYFGEIGEKNMTITGVICHIGNWIDGKFGSFRYVTIIDEPGHCIKFTQSPGRFDNEIIIGKEFKCTATIDSHKDYQGNRSTHIKSIKITN
jgi:hypothetical protein